MRKTKRYHKKVIPSASECFDVTPDSTRYLGNFAIAPADHKKEKAKEALVAKIKMLLDGSGLKHFYRVLRSEWSGNKQILNFEVTFE